MKLEFKKDALLNGINIVSKRRFRPEQTLCRSSECILIDADAGRDQADWK